MHLAHLRLRDYRNYPKLDIDLGPGLHLLTGANAQGKTNLLEAIYLLATLRSFRGAAPTQLLREGTKAYFIGATVVSEASHRIKIYWSRSERKIALNGAPIQRLADYYGTLRAVVFCNEDVHLVKGPGHGRRRFLNLLLTQTYPHYLPLLQRYTRTLRSRNALLKQRHPDPPTLQGFTKELVDVGRQLTHLREKLIPQIAPRIQEAYTRLADNPNESFRMVYQPSVKEDFAVELANSRERERTLQTTVIGPHRDDVKLLINERSAIQYGSEGQKRSLAIAFKMAQAEYLTHLYGAPPVLLIDDVMGELDPKRRASFFPLLSDIKTHRGQAFMTATEVNWPNELGTPWQHWEVSNGSVAPA